MWIAGNFTIKWTPPQVFFDSISQHLWETLFYLAIQNQI